MARIEWQPLAIPDIGESALRAQQAAGSSVRSAFQDLSGVVDQWKGQRREENLTELYRRQNRFALGAVGPDGKPTGMPDVAGYVGDLADGDLMGDLSYLNASDIAAARSYTGELRTGRAAEETRNRNIFEQNRTDTTFDREETERITGQNIARTLLPLRQEAERTGDLTAYRAAMATILEANPGATAAQIESMLDGGQEAERAFRETRNSNQSYESTRYTFERTLRTDRQNDRAQVILNELTTSHMDSRAALAALNSNYGSEDAEVLNAIRAQIPTAFATLDSVTAPEGETGNAPASYTAPSGGFAGGASDSSRVLNYEARAAGFARLPDRIRTVGDVSDYAIALNNRGVRSSATGTYQIVGQTLRGKNNQNGYAERVLGRGWRNVEWTLEVEDRIAEAIFNDHKNSAAALRGQWVSLSTAEAERVRNMPWAQARLIISRGESGAIPAPTPAGTVRTSRANLEAGLAVGTDGNFTGNRTARAVEYLAASQRPAATPQAIATELTAEGSVFASVPTARIRDDIDRLMRETGVSAAIAGWALAGTVRNRNWVDRAFSVSGITGPVSTDYAAAKARVMSTRTNETRENLSLVQRNVEILAQLNAAEAAANAARQRFATAQERFRVNGNRGDLSPYIAAVQSTQAALNQAQALADRADISRPAGERPPERSAPAPQMSYLQTPVPPRQSLYRNGGSVDRR